MSKELKLVGIPAARMGIRTVFATGGILLVLSGPGIAVHSHAETADALVEGAPPPMYLLTPATGTSLAAPARNTVFACRGGVLTRPATPWIDAQGVIDVMKRPVVEGTVQWDSEFTVTLTTEERHFKGNGLPNHPTGQFPVQPGTAAYEYYSALPAEGYPNAAAVPIAPWDLDFSVPRDPMVAAQPTCIDKLTTGVALTGATFHLEIAVDEQNRPVDPDAALPLDRCWGHPYHDQYHYHGLSVACFGQVSEGQAVGEFEHSPLVGWAIDGFGIYGPRGEHGEPVKNENLDVCHGHTHAIIWDGKSTVMYHYHLNGEYPYSIGCFRGAPASLPPQVH